MSTTSSVSARIGGARLGKVRLGGEGCGRELEIVDRVLETIPLRVLKMRPGKERSREARRGWVWAVYSGKLLYEVTFRWQHHKVWPGGIENG